MANRNERDAGQVGVDHSTLRGEPASSDTRYTVGLTGSVDDQWVEAYRLTQSESTGHRRFRLDRANAAISFSTRTVDGPAMVIEVLEQLDAFLELVNGQVEMWRMQAPTATPAPAPRGFA
ncbi:MAG: hypothetical protein WEB59_16745 [Thermoanaerobaculia bacterium]